MLDIPYAPGALYSRRNDIHDRYGGQRQGGISTPAKAPLIFIFTGEAGKAHGYADFWDDDGVFHYFGEGQKGDMQLVSGNRAILRHTQDGRRLLLFQMMGKSRPYRYLGEFECLSYYEMPEIPDTDGRLRTAIVFRLRPIADVADSFKVAEREVGIELESTAALRSTEVRSKQSLFRRRLIGVEKECRLTGVRDLRFLRASHIKPWADCATGNERIDGHNGLLLTPAADHLFDQGWISFGSDGRLLRTDDFPSDVAERIGLDVKAGRTIGEFSERQQHYLEYHRNAVFRSKYKRRTQPHEALIKALDLL